MCRSAHQDDQVMNLIGIIRIFWKILTFCGETCFCNYSVICLKNQMIVMCNILLYIYICPFFLFLFFSFLFFLFFYSMEFWTQRQTVLFRVAEPEQ